MLGTIFEIMYSPRRQNSSKRPYSGNFPAVIGFFDMVIETTEKDENNESKTMQIVNTIILF